MAEEVLLIGRKSTQMTATTTVSGDKLVMVSDPVYGQWYAIPYNDFISSLIISRPASPSTVPDFTNITYKPDTLNVVYPNFNNLTPTQPNATFIHNGTSWTLQESVIDLTGYATAASIDSKIGGYFVPSKNLFNGVTFPGYFTTTGDYDASDTSFKVSDYIDVVAGQSYYLSGRNAGGGGNEHSRTVFYDVSKVKLAGTFNGGYANPLGGVLMTAPASAKFVRFGIEFPTSHNLASIQFEKGTAATSYQAFGSTVDKAKLPIDVVYKADTYLKSDGVILAQIVYKNLFNKATIVTGKYVDNTGASSDASSHNISDFIPVKPFTTYYFSGRNNTNSTDATGIAIYDANKNPLAFSSAMFPDASGITNYYTGMAAGRIVTPVNSAFIRFTVDRLFTNNADTIQLEEGTQKTAYQDFNKGLIPAQYIPGLSDVAPTQMTWEAIGTSLTYLNDHLDETANRVTKGYLTRVINELPNVTYRNRGKNGYSTNGLASEMTAWQAADIYSIEAGTNDWGFGSRVTGTINDYINNTGVGTVAGAYRAMIDKCYSLNPSALIILITDAQRSDFVYVLDKTNTAQGSYAPINNRKLSEFADIVKEIAKYEGLPVVDMYYESGLNQHTAVKYKRLKNPSTGVYQNYVYPAFIGIAYNGATDDYPYPTDAISYTYDGLHWSDKTNAIAAKMIVEIIKKHL